MGLPAWILVAGTGQEPLDPALAAAARRLGAQLASARFSLVTCGWSGVDREVGSAFVDEVAAQGEDARGRFKQLCALGRVPSVAAGQLVRVGQDAEEYLGSAREADVAVMLGGSGGTLVFLEFTRMERVPMLPIPSTGGDARTAFDRIRASFDPDLYLGITRSELEALDRPPEEAIAVAVRLTRQYIEARAIRDGHYLTPDHVVGRENEQAFERLVVEMREAGVLAFVGAGTSISSGYPSWGELVDGMRKALPDQVSRAMAFVSREDDVLMRAEQYRQLMGEQAFAAFIREQFDDDRGTLRALHEDIVRLPFKHVLTTNYDTLLERAHIKATGERPLTASWHNAANIEAFLHAARRKQRRRYVHLHGIYDEPTSIVLTERDYQQRYHESAAGEALLSVLFTAHAFLFIGFSFSDVDMMGVFRGTMARLRLGEPQHFAFVALDPQRQDPTLVRQRLRMKFKIEPIFYLVTPDHAGLHELIHRLLASVP